MIKREYFVRAKVQHNNDSGLYSWWSGVLVIPSLLPKGGDFVFEQAMICARINIEPEFEGMTNGHVVEIESLNRIK